MEINREIFKRRNKRSNEILIIYLKNIHRIRSKTPRAKIRKKLFSCKRPFQCLNRIRSRFAQRLQVIESEKKSSQRNENKNGLDANDILFNVKLVQNILNQVENKINNIQKKNKELSNKNKDIESQFISIIQSNERKNKELK